MDANPNNPPITILICLCIFISPLCTTFMYSDGSDRKQVFSAAGSNARTRWRERTTILGDRERARELCDRL